MKLRPINNDKIHVDYILRDDIEEYYRLSTHSTYEDFGEWVCRNFDKIRIVNVEVK